MSESEKFPKKFIRSFGRIKSRKLSQHKNFLLEDGFLKYSIESQKTFRSDDADRFHILEIGFGFGDFIFSAAKNNSENLYFGFEPHINGVANLLAKLEEFPLKNIFISKQDIRDFSKNFPDNFFDEIYILFPDPWPKIKHFKRRLICDEFIENFLSTKLKKAGKLVIASDHDDYKTWILSKMTDSKNFKMLAKSEKDWLNFPDNWIETKYQKKAKIEGRTSIYLEFEKC